MTENEKEVLGLPWHIGNTSSDQIMFINSKEDYAGGVTIRQFQGRGAYDEPRRTACAHYILEAVNNLESLKAREAELVAACKAWLLWGSEVYAAKETGESGYSYGELQALRVDAEAKARAALKGKV